MPVLTQQEQNKKRINSDFYVEGFAANYERYILFDFDDGPIYEQFHKENFRNTDMSDVIMQYDHSGRVMARMSNKTLIVEVSDSGLFVAADLSKTDASRGLYSDISTGMVTKMSWAFLPGEVDYDPEQRLITYKNIRKIYDVSAVSLPANDTTSIGTRSFITAQMEFVRAKVREAAKKRLALKLMLALSE